MWRPWTSLCCTSRIPVDDTDAANGCYGWCNCWNIDAEDQIIDETPTKNGVVDGTDNESQTVDDFENKNESFEDIRAENETVDSADTKNWIVDDSYNPFGIVAL